MSKDIKTFNFSSSQDAIDAATEIVDAYKESGLVVLKGHAYSTDEQVEVAKALGDILDWNLCSGADDMVVQSSIYPGGHSDNVEKEYNQSEEEYVLDWHIEQVYYLHPILAGVWSMTDFTATRGHGNTRFVDSIEIFKSFSREDQDFLSKSIIKWDKQSPQRSGPYYTNAVQLHPISKESTLRIETDQGCMMYPELYAWDGAEATEEQKAKFLELRDTLKDALNSDESIRYSQEWEQGDLLIVDLFRMYHAVMGGFVFGERKFTGIGIRPKIYDNTLHIEPRLS